MIDRGKFGQFPEEILIGLRRNRKLLEHLVDCSSDFLLHALRVFLHIAAWTTVESVRCLRTPNAVLCVRIDYVDNDRSFCDRPLR